MVGVSTGKGDCVEPVVLLVHCVVHGNMVDFIDVNFFNRNGVQVVLMRH